MTGDSRRPVVVGVDGSASGLVAARLAAVEAAARNSPVRVVHCFVWPTYEVPNYGELRRDAERIVHESVVAVTALAPGTPVSGEVVDGAPGPVLRAESRGASLAVLGRSDPDHRFADAESAVVYVAAGAACPVMIAHPARQTGGPVLVGVDGSPDAAAAMRFAIHEAAARQTDVVAVYVEPGGAESEGPLATPLAEARQVAGPVKVEPRWISGEPGEALINESATGQMIVVGARGRLRSLLGTVSYALLRHAHCPVAVVRG